MDDARSMLQAIEDSAESLSWPTGYWVSVRINVTLEKPLGFDGEPKPFSDDLVSVIGRSGQPDCFLAAIKFIYENPEWPKLSG